MTLRRTLRTLVALVLVPHATPAPACAFFEPTLFVSPYTPDVPAGRFVAGEPGVLQPTWIRAYLVVAYRELAGLPLTADERAGAVAYFAGPGTPSTDGLDAWRKEREAATGTPGPSIETEKAAGYATYVNCGDDAFRLAAATLAGYVKSRGASAAETRGWIAAQDLVFANCGASAPSVPGALPASAPAALRADRAYQMAAASFYSGRFVEAQKAFEEIASDGGSRWNHLAAFAASRALVRRATLATEDPVEFRTLMSEARRRFSSLSETSADAKIRRASGDLVRFADLRLDPAARLPEAAARVLEPRPGDDFSTTFVHYRDLLFRVLGFGPEPGDYVPDPKDDLTSWIVAFQDPSPRGLERALAGFARARTAPWIAAVLAKIPASHPRAAEVVEAARRLPAGSPGRLHVAYHLARLAVEGNRPTEARALVGANLSAAEAAGASATNLFLELKARTASSFEEFSAAAPRRVLYPDWAEADALAFEQGTQDVVNRRLPLDLLWRFATTAKLTPKAADEARRIVFTRAVLLGRADVARAAAPPDAKVTWDAPDWRLDALFTVVAEDASSRPYAALDFPFSIAWWCPLSPPAPGEPDPAFLTDAERRTAAEEVARLGAQPAAATLFCREAIAFAKEKPDDPRAPRFLGRAVRATREGCGDAKTRAASRAAFELLHRRYPKSAAAGETKYWFEGRGR